MRNEEIIAIEQKTVVTVKTSVSLEARIWWVMAYVITALSPKMQPSFPLRKICSAGMLSKCRIQSGPLE